MHLIRASVNRALAIIRRDLASEDGFTMFAALGVMLVTTMLSVAAFAAANGDITVSRVDQDRKQAFAAAEAGMNDYTFHLADDPSYWSYCTTNPSTGSALPGVNQAWDGSGTDTRTQQRNVPGTSGAYYKLELIPANGATACDPNNAANTMIDTATGTFRIRATGYYRAEKRTIISTFRRRSFLDYVYFTDLETQDPQYFWTSSPTRISAADLTDYVSYMAGVKGAGTGCNTYYRNGRATNPVFNGQTQDGTGAWVAYTGGACKEITFAGYDTLAGPVHTNDEFLICNNPTFGRTAQDRIEVSAPAPGHRGSPLSGCTDSPNFLGTFNPGSPTLTLPPSNTELRNFAGTTYKFAGKTTIVLTGSTMTVTNAAKGLVNVSMALPANGVIYVDDGSCTLPGSTPSTKDYSVADPAGCALAIVKGTYSQGLTIASKGDILINGDLTHSANGLLGLIADNFVKVYHPADFGAPNYDGHNATTAPYIPYGAFNNNITIEAAILALNHSFLMDNDSWGAPMGTLTIKGALAQKYRGLVSRATTGGTITHGYAKNYQYDDRLAYLTPPHFLDPIQSAWRLVRQTEQIPAR